MRSRCRYTQTNSHDITSTMTAYDDMFDNNYNADNDDAPGYWDDVLGHPNYPSHLEIAGNAGSRDRFATTSCLGCCVGNVGSVVLAAGLELVTSQTRGRLMSVI